MNARYTLALLVGFVALAVAAYYLGKDREPREMTAGTPTATPAPMFALSASDVQEVDVISATQGITLTRAAGGWQVNGQPASDMVDGTISRIAPLTVIRELTDKDPDNYGFATPSLTVTIKTSKGESHILVFGDETPVDGNIYVRVNGEGNILVVENTDIATLKGWFMSPPYAPTATPEAMATPLIGPAPAGLETPGAGTPTAAILEPKVTELPTLGTPTPLSLATATPTRTATP